MRYFFISMLAVLISSTLHAKDLILSMDGPISSRTIAPLQDALDAHIQADKKSPVTLIISSPGGEVYAGIRFITSMLEAQARGVKINCYVTNMAASMAFQIFTQCSSRFALNTSLLLWHGVRVKINEPITARLAVSLSEDMDRIDQLIVWQLRGVLKMKEADILHHFHAETLWSGFTLGEAAVEFMQTANAFPGVQQMKGVAVKSAVPGFFDYSPLSEDFTITYIWQKYTER